jgi:3-phenylpropionate/cinnamic acid dioxygenase small subunit
LLNHQKYEDWLELFSVHGKYWIPLKGAEQNESEVFNCLLSESRQLLKIRIARLYSKHNHSNKLKNHSHHLIQTPLILITNEVENRFQLETNFHYIESHGEQETFLAGHWIHDLIVDQGNLKILNKRVNFFNIKKLMPSIYLFP